MAPQDDQPIDAAIDSEAQNKPISTIVIFIAMHTEALPLVNRFQLKEEHDSLFPKGVPWVRYHGMYKDLHINIVQPGKDPALGGASNCCQLCKMHGITTIQKAITRIHQAGSLNRIALLQNDPGDEVEDMFLLLNEVKRQTPAIAAVSSGAIASDYQRLRVESVCSRLGHVSLSYLWKQEQSLLFQEMISSGIFAIIVKVAAIGLHPAKHLGKELAESQSYLHHLNGLYGSNVCGEGGEYVTLPLDCPLFKFARIVLDDFQVILHSPDSIAPVGVLRLFI